MSVYLPCLFFADVFIISFIFLTCFYHPLFLPFFKLFLTLVSPPELQTIPDQTVTQGLNVTFTCIATVGFGLSYLWTIPHLNCIDCGPVALNIPTITLTDVSNEAQGLYTCTVADFVNQTATTSSMLTVAGTYLSTAWINCIHSKNNCLYVKVQQMSRTTCYCLYAHVHVYNMSVYLSIYTSISLSITSHLILFLLGWLN